MGEGASSSPRTRVAPAAHPRFEETYLLGGMVSQEAVFMQRALDLAAGARYTSPNPRVGAVVVRDGEVMGEGRHEGAGRPHAEAVALQRIDAAGSTIYVTLEPCTHQGRTPPCAPALVAAGVARVVIAAIDPDERVGGRGITYLRDRGIKVEVGLLEREARVLNAPYFHHRSTGRPLVTLKLALTLDGRLAAPDGSSEWITGPAARLRVHRRRSEVDAVLVGANTVLTDNPSLTAREVDAPSSSAYRRDDSRQPTRIVVDAAGRIPTTAKIFDGPGEVIIATTSSAAHDVQTGWKEKGAEVLVLDGTGAGVGLSSLVDALGRRGLLEVYCEGGGAVATSLLREDLVGRLELYYGGVIAGRGGPEIGDLEFSSLGEASRWTTQNVERVGDDLFTEMHSPVLTGLLEAHQTEEIVETISQTNEVVSTIRKTNKAG